MLKTALTILGGALALWAGAGFVLWRWQEKLIFFPRPTPPDVARDLADLAVNVAAEDGTPLRGWEHPGNAAAAESDCKLLVYFGGNGEELSSHPSENGARFPFPQWYVNYRGFGGSGGAPSAELLRADALRVFDEAARRRRLAPEEICIMGRSLGSHMAAHVAARRAAKKLIMVTPFDSVLEIARRRYPFFPVRKMLRHPFDTLAEAGSVSAPVLFLLAETDRVVPPARAENLIANWRTPHTALTIPGTTHNRMDTPAYWRAIADFLSPENPE
ncbi:MAG: alpha/beta hydrolase [Gammaproteobacteria bacterium]